MVKSTALSVARDQRREAIMAVAREVFFEEGYTGASMSSIAARVGGSKGTLYNYFKNKQELFEAQVRELCGHASDVLSEVPSGSDVPSTLSRFGEEYLRHLFSEKTIKTFRILVAEAQRNPELARVFYEVGPAHGKRVMQHYLERATALGQLQVADTALAAEQFLILCKGATHLQFLLNVIPPLTAEQISAQIARAVDAFMVLYGGRSASRR